MPEINPLQSRRCQNETIIFLHTLTLTPFSSLRGGVEFPQASVEVSSDVYAFEMREGASDLSFAADGRGPYDRVWGQVLQAGVRGGWRMGEDDDVAGVFAGADDA